MIILWIIFILQIDTFETLKVSSDYYQTNQLQIGSAFHINLDLDLKRFNKDFLQLKNNKKEDWYFSYRFVNLEYLENGQYKTLAQKFIEMKIGGVTTNDFFDKHSFNEIIHFEFESNLVPFIRKDFLLTIQFVNFNKKISIILEHNYIIDLPLNSKFTLESILDNQNCFKIPIQSTLNCYDQKTLLKLQIKQRNKRIDPESLDIQTGNDLFENEKGPYQISIKENQIYIENLFKENFCSQNYIRFQIQICGSEFQNGYFQVMNQIFFENLLVNNQETFLRLGKEPHFTLETTYLQYFQNENFIWQFNLQLSEDYEISDATFLNINVNSQNEIFDQPVTLLMVQGNFKFSLKIQFQGNCSQFQIPSQIKLSQKFSIKFNTQDKVENLQNQLDFNFILYDGVQKITQLKQQLDKQDDPKVEAVFRSYQRIDSLIELHYYLKQIYLESVQINLKFPLQLPSFSSSKILVNDVEIEEYEFLSNQLILKMKQIDQQRLNIEIQYESKEKVDFGSVNLTIKNDLQEIIEEMDLNFQ